MPPVIHYDPAALDLTHVVVDLEAIRKVNPQRFEMEQLTAIVHLDPESHVIVGYKDVGGDDNVLSEVLGNASTDHQQTGGRVGDLQLGKLIEVFCGVDRD